jgi:hypothetical protein
LGEFLLCFLSQFAKFADENNKSMAAVRRRRGIEEAPRCGEGDVNGTTQVTNPTTQGRLPAQKTNSMPRTTTQRNPFYCAAAEKTIKSTK